MSWKDKGWESESGIFGVEILEGFQLLIKLTGKRRTRSWGKRNSNGDAGVLWGYNMRILKSPSIKIVGSTTVSQELKSLRR